MSDYDTTKWQNIKCKASKKDTEACMQEMEEKNQE